MNTSDAPLFDDIAQGPAEGRDFWRETSDGVRIRLGLWPAAQTDSPVGTVLLFPGRTEYIEKYGLIAAELADRGFATLSIDWRGKVCRIAPTKTACWAMWDTSQSTSWTWPP